MYNTYVTQMFSVLSKLSPYFCDECH